MFIFLTLCVCVCVCVLLEWGTTLSSEQRLWIIWPTQTGTAQWQFSSFAKMINSIMVIYLRIFWLLSGTGHSMPWGQVFHFHKNGRKFNFECMCEHWDWREVIVSGVWRAVNTQPVEAKGHASKEYPTQIWATGAGPSVEAALIADTIFLRKAFS